CREFRIYVWRSCFGRINSCNRFKLFVPVLLHQELKRSHAAGSDCRSLGSRCLVRSALLSAASTLTQVTILFGALGYSLFLWLIQRFDHDAVCYFFVTLQKRICRPLDWNRKKGGYGGSRIIVAPITVEW